jgi:penicillin-binding protein 1A
VAIELPAGPLSGPRPTRNRRRNPFWRFRRIFFVLAVVASVGVGAVWSFASQVELEEDNFDDLIETTYICTNEVPDDCGPDNATNEIALQGEDRVVVDYSQIPQVMIDAVVATEDKSFFEHRGIDPGGLMRAAYQIGKKTITRDSSGSFQGGSTITQQYIKLATNDDSVSVSRKGREIVRAIKLEQELTESLGSKQAAKEQILERYLNRALFGRGVYGVQAAARAYFDVDVEELTLPEAAYLAGLLKSPNTGDAYTDPTEGDRRRRIPLAQMVEYGFITPEEQIAAEADTWPRLIPPPETVVGLGPVKGAEYGTEYFISAVRRQLSTIYPQGEYFTQSLRVYTTLDPELQKLAYDTVSNKLNPDTEFADFAPLGALASVNENGEVVAMMGGESWEDSQVNLATGRAGGGSGFQAGSLMKTYALAEFIEQGFSPDSYFEAPTVMVFPQDREGICARWRVRGGVSSRKDVVTHRTVFQATAGSLNTVYAQLTRQVGAAQVIDLAGRLGLDESSFDVICPSIVLGTNSVSPVEMAGSYSHFAREGERLDPAIIQRIEDADGNVLCWYPVDSCQAGGGLVRQGEQVIDASVARQVNRALVGVVQGGTGRAGRLTDPETETTRPAAGKTGTTQNNRDAWFTGFTCGYTTSVWVGYPGEAGKAPLYMNDNQNQVNAELTKAELRKQQNGGVATDPAPDDEDLVYPELSEFPTMEQIFGTDEYNNSRGNGDITGGEIPTEIWHDFMMAATADGPPCEELPTEGPSDDQLIVGQELLTTLLHCSEPDPALVAAAEAAAAGETTTTTGSEQPESTQQGSTSSTDTTAPPTTAPPTTESSTTAAPTTEVTPPTTEQQGEPPEGGDDEQAAALLGLVDQSGVGSIQRVAYRPAPAQNNEEQQQPQPTTTTTVAPTVPPPTTEPCLPIDLDGNLIETTTLLPGQTVAPAPSNPSNDG